MRPAIPASLKSIFLSQCIDHAFGVFLGTFLMVSAFSLFATLPVSKLSTFGPFFWVGFVGVLFCASLLCRMISLALSGATVGNHVIGLRPSEIEGKTNFWVGQIIESLQPAIPALWAFELMARSQGSRFPSLRYIVDRA